MPEKPIYLETYDPKWQEKFDRIMPRVKELNEKGWLTNEELAEQKSLAVLLCTICDAGLKTPQEFMERHLYFAVKEADKLGIVFRWPDVPPDASIYTVREAVAEVTAYIEMVKRDREREAHRERFRDAEQYQPTPKPSWRNRFGAMFASRLGRDDRDDMRGSV